MKKTTGYQKIMLAAERGTGVWLPWENVVDMSLDPAISDAALNDYDDPYANWVGKTNEQKRP